MVYLKSLCCMGNEVHALMRAVSVRFSRSYALLSASGLVDVVPCRLRGVTILPPKLAACRCVGNCSRRIWEQRGSLGPRRIVRAIAMVPMIHIGRVYGRPSFQRLIVVFVTIGRRGVRRWTIRESRTPPPTSCARAHNESGGGRKLRAPGPESRFRLQHTPTKPV